MIAGCQVTTDDRFHSCLWRLQVFLVIGSVYSSLVFVQTRTRPYAIFLCVCCLWLCVGMNNACVAWTLKDIEKMLDFHWVTFSVTENCSGGTPGWWIHLQSCRTLQLRKCWICGRRVFWLLVLLWVIALGLWSRESFWTLGRPFSIEVPV